MIIEAEKHIVDYATEDPVRPNIEKAQRINERSKVLYYITPTEARVDEQDPEAIVCVKFCNNIPTNEIELENFTGLDNSVLILYTVWSYKRGAGAELVRELVPYVKKHFPAIKRICTLSPKTRTARVFHIRNGAFELQENDETINYEYSME